MAAFALRPPTPGAHPGHAPHMVNQVTFEGYLVRAWSHGSFRYLRLANHRPPQMGGQTGGPIPVESDYVTARLDPSVDFDMQRATPGLRLILRGRIEGRDIPETIRDILQHCHLNIPISLDIAGLQVTRPAVQIYCTTLEFRSNKPRSGKSKWDRRHVHRNAQGQPPHDQPHPGETNAARQPTAIVVSEGQKPPDGAAGISVHPGGDLAELVKKVESGKDFKSPIAKALEPKAEKKTPARTGKKATDRTEKADLRKAGKKIPIKEDKSPEK